MSGSNYLIFRTRRRFDGSERPDEVYDSIYSKLSELALPWGLQGTSKVPLIEHRGAVTYGVKYPKVEKTSPIKNFILGFMNRSRTDTPADESVNDDTLTAEFYPKKVQESWEYLLDVVFPAYIVGTNPYVGMLFDAQIYTNDRQPYNPVSDEFVPNPNYVDLRNGVHRVWQANYWDRELCRRAFNLTPSEIVERLNNKVANCRIFHDGVIVICSYEPILGAEILNLNDRVLPFLLPPG